MRRAELSVLIRTFEIAGRRRVELGVGGGITVDSVPVREWQECLHKAEPLVGAAGSRLIRVSTTSPVRLIERWPSGRVRDDPGPARPIVRLAGHLARLDRSCRELYGPACRTIWPDAIVAAVGRQTPVARLAIRLQARPEQGAPAITSAPGRSDPGWRRHRCAGCRGRAELAAQVGRPRQPGGRRAGGRCLRCPTSLSRPAGLITETSRGNLFWRGADGVWCTPPLDEQVLPGVTRREVMES